MPSFDNYVVFDECFSCLFGSCSLLLVPHALRASVRVYCMSTKRFCDVGHLSKRAGIRHTGNQLRLIERTKDILDRLYMEERSARSRTDGRKQICSVIGVLFYFDGAA